MKPSVRRTCWCGAHHARPLFLARDQHGTRFRYVRCTGCQVVAQHPMPTNEQLAPYYASDYYGATPRKFVGPVARFVQFFQGARARLVARHVRSPQPRLLDIGCGNGGFLLQMKHRGFAVEGTEWTSASAARVPSHEHIPVHVGDLLDLDLPPSTYDAITLWHVFEHLRDPQRTLARIHTLLKPRGLLFLALPNQESWQAEHYGPHWFHLDPPRHLHNFGPRSLKQLLRRERFQPLSLSTWSFEQNPYGILQSQLNAWGFPRERAYETLKGTNKLGYLTDLALVAALSAPATAAALAEATLRRGGTMTLIAQRHP